jgi:aminoglycoside 3-N-acetyltransferase
MVHASVRAVGKVAGGPDEIHLAIKDVVTPTGAMIMYAGCPQYVDEIGRGGLSAAEEAELLEKLPPFDAESARSSRDNGALVELFRTYPGSRVNHHPARFGVWGAPTDYLLSEQPWDYAFGHGSLFERFVRLGGKILLLGSDHDNVTFLHYTEHIIDIPDKRITRFKVPVLENGSRVWREMAEFDTSKGVHANWPSTFFSQLVDGYLGATHNRGGRVGDAPSYLFSAHGLHDYSLPIMRAVAAGQDRHPREPDARPHAAVELSAMAASIVAPVSRQLAVSDLERSVRFYRDILGFEVRRPADASAVDDRSRKIEVVRGPARIELTATAAVPAPNGDHRILFFETDDAAAMHGALESAGARPSALEDVNWIKMRVFEVRDPDGNVLWFGTPFGGPNAPRPDRMLRAIMPELPLTDVPAGVAYYRDVLGFTVNYAQHDIGVMDRDKTRLLLVARSSRHTGIGSCYVYVEDADALHAELVAKGANVQGEPLSQPWGLREFRVLDPEGNQISFGQPFE